MQNSKSTEMIAKLILLATTQDAKEKQQLIKEIADISNEESRDEWERLLKFTDKEISNMPKYFKKEFRTNGLRAHIRKRKRGNSINYEIRCRSKGYDISASGVTIEEAKGKFIDKLHAIDSGTEKITVPTTFDKFIIFYFENYRIKKVANDTYYNDMTRVKRHILPYFKSMTLKSITPQFCQKLIDNLIEQGKEKTAEEIFSLLNCTFKYAIAHGIIQINPMATVFRQTHDRVHGNALSKDEEYLLLSETEEKMKLYFALILYTGLRPNEYKTLKRKGNILLAVNSKRKHKKVEYKRIPINPMLSPIIGDLTEFNFPCTKTLVKSLKRVLPNAKLYDLRTTFYTRCQEFKVAETARDIMIGHSLGALANAYTDLSNEYLINEANKLKYDLPPNLPPKNQ